MEERLAATTASLKQSIQRMKEITARSKSTDATLARIARMQASWAPTEQVVQESMERRQDSFARNMDAAAQALARISGAMVSTPTSSTTAHHDTEKAVQVTTPTTPLSAASTVANLDFSCRQEKRMDELSSSINTNLAAVASLQKGMECCWDSTQVPATTTESTRLVPASVLAAHLLLTDRMVATRDPERVLRIGAPKVFEEIPSKPSAADTMKEADTTLAWCRQLVPTTVARIAGSQLDPFICADQVCEEKDMLVNKEGASGVVCKLFSAEPLMVWDDDICDDVITHIGSLSLFWEPGLASIEDVCTGKISKDMASHEELVEAMLSHVGGWSLFIEHDMINHWQFQGSIGMDKTFDLLASRKCTQSAISVCCSNPDILSHMVKQMKATCQILVQFTHKSSPQLVCIVEATSFFHVEHLWVPWLSRTWDPGSSRFRCWVLHNNFFAANIIFYFLLIHLHVLEDGQSTALAGELHIQWDPGIVENVLMATMFVQLPLKSVALHVLYTKIFMHRQWNPCIYSITCEGGTQLISELAFVGVIWQYQFSPWDLFFQEELVHQIQQRFFSSGQGFLVLGSLTETRVFYSQLLAKESLGNFSMIINSAQFLCDIQSVDLDRKLQYSPWNLGVHNQMTTQVQQELCKCYYFCYPIHLANDLQYKQWDPGVMWVLGAERDNASLSTNMGNYGSDSMAERRFLYRSWSYSLLQSE